MKKLISAVIFFCFFLSCILLSQAYLLKQKTVQSLTQDITKITQYAKWGYQTGEFEKLYSAFLSQVQRVPFYIFPFRLSYFNGKHDNILRLTQAGYATEVTQQKGAIQSRLTYLRERVKADTTLPQLRKSVYSDRFEVIAGTIFEINSDLVAMQQALRNLDEQDKLITAEVESVKKESVTQELQGYKATCADLLSFFNGKNHTTDSLTAQNCMTEVDTLLGARYQENGADFLAALGRERVFTLMQKAQAAQQHILQQEQYVLGEKKQAEERLVIVPPAPLHEGKVVVVNIPLQRLYAYENGTPLFPSAVPITTGKYGFETVTGSFEIYLKEHHHKMTSPFPGIYYDDVVNYWMPFYLGYGLHDAPWRSIYGTQDYGLVGSHGCINIPLKETSILYNWAEVGTRVIVL